MLMLHVDVNMKQLGFLLKTTRFNDSESTLSSRDNNFIHGALSDLKLCRIFHSLRAVLHTA